MTTLWSQISLRNAWWLLLALQPLLMWMLAGLRQRMRKDEFADASLLPWVMSRQGVTGRHSWWRQLALLLAWCALATAMAGPRIQQRVVGGDEKHDLILQVVVDVSYSMSARDVIPTRLQRVKLELQDLISRLQQTRMGIIVYAARAHVMIPPTSDKSVLRQVVEVIRVRSLPTEGSDMFTALSLARQQLVNSKKQARAILLVSDGEVSDDSAQAQQGLTHLVTALRQDNIRLFTLGVGTAQGSALLDDQNGWLQQNGRSVVTRLHSARLQQLANTGNGDYAEVADDDSEWQLLYDAGIARMQARPIHGENGQLIVWQDLSPWFVLPGIMLLLLAYVRLSEVKPATTAAFLLCLVFVAAMLQTLPSQAAQPSYPDAFALYQVGKYQQAVKQFARLPGYRARMGEGTSLYQLKQYPNAAAVFIQAVLDANTDAQRADALFNLANCYFKQDEYRRAANTYRDALRYRPLMAMAKTNLAYAQALQEKAQQTPGAPTRRAGTGARMAPAAANTDVGKGRVSLDDSNESTPLHRSPAVPSSGPAQPAQLAEKARAVTGKIDLDKDVQWTYDITRARDISVQDALITVDKGVFWQRLYESEEDFPAPRERPEVLPGVPPW